jgi:hypothetical protein
MTETVPYLFLYQPEKSEVEKFQQFLSKVTQVNNWSEIVEKIKIMSPR